MVKVKKENIKSKTTIEKDEIPELTQKVQEHKKEYEGRKEERVKEYFATKDALINHSKRDFIVRLPVDREDDGTIIKMMFKVRRLTQEERSTMEALRPINPYTQDNRTPEEISKATEQGYEVLSKVVIDPELTVDDWRQFDVALTETLISKITLLQFETNDADVISKLKN